jgi:hypothetical protein
MWGALSDERTGLSFTIAAGPSQRSHSRVRVPWDSLPYFTVSDSRLPLSDLHSYLITCYQASSAGDNEKIHYQNCDIARTSVELG